MSSSYLELRVPGRICLLGDKIDLNGFPVIAAAISRLLTLKIRKLDTALVILFSENLKTGLTFRFGEKGNHNHPLKYLCAIVDRLESRIGGFEAIINSEIPIGSGLSSSAAICVALIRGLNQLFQLNMNTREISEMSYCVEHDDLGIICGRMDPYSISFGGVTFIETGEKPLVIPLNISSLPIVIGDSQQYRQAKTILNDIKQKLKEKDSLVQEAFNTIHECVIKGREALLKNDYKTLGELMTLHHQQDNILNVSTPLLNDLCSSTLSAGALGAKIIGAGGGGCIIALCPGRQEQVVNAILECGGLAIISEIYNYEQLTRI